MEYQVQMVYQQEDVGALVRALDFRRRPEANLRRARKIGYTVFGVLLILVALCTMGGMVYAGVFSPLAIVTVIIAVLAMRKSSSSICSPCIESSSGGRYVRMS